VNRQDAKHAKAKTNKESRNGADESSRRLHSVGTARCAVPVAERSVRRRNNLWLAIQIAPQPGADGAARHPYHTKFELPGAFVRSTRVVTGL
jgi:hypothetical protein